MLEIILSFMVCLVFCTLGTTIGYHRLLAHRSFRCPKAVEYFFVGCGYLAFQTSPIWWASMHRIHHKYSDQEKDPHAILHGWRRSVYGWIFDERYPEYLDKNQVSPDLMSDPIYRFLDCNGDVQKGHLLNGFLNFICRFAMVPFFGWKIALGSLLAGLAMQQITLWFNLVSHMPQWGYKNYDTADDSTNNAFLTVLTLGEGLHNNHHAVPGSANNSMTKDEIDIGWWIISGLRKVGLVSWANDGFAHRLESNLRISPNGLDRKKMGPIPVPSEQMQEEPVLVKS